MRILITGVAGFVGSNLAARLVTEGHTVIGVDNLSSGVAENVPPRVIFYRTDIRSRRIFQFFEGVEAVFHLAAKNCLLDCLQDPVETAEINVAGTANVLEAARRAGVQKLVYADSSGHIGYYAAGRIPPLSVYARSKRAGAMFCEAYADFYRLRLTTVRYFNVYGPAQDWRRSIPPLMSAFAMKLLKRERPIIYGTGEKRRDFIYIDDVTEFNVLALQDPRTDGCVYNVGSGVNYSVNDIFLEVEDLLRTGLAPIYRDDLPGEAEITLADIGTALKFGWRPRVGLREGIVKSIAYVREKVLV